MSPLRSAIVLELLANLSGTVDENIAPIDEACVSDALKRGSAGFCGFYVDDSVLIGFDQNRVFLFSLLA